MSPRSRLLALATTALGLWLARGQFVTTDDALGVSPVRRAAGADARPPSANANANATVNASSDTGLPRTAPTLPTLPMRQVLAGTGADPFAAPRVAVKAPPPPPPVVVASPSPPPPPPPPPAPRVPYRYVGMLSEKGQAAGVYLALGDKLIDARPGDVLEGGYQLKSISATELLFLQSQSQLTVRLAVDGEPL